MKRLAYYTMLIWMVLLAFVAWGEDSIGSVYHDGTNLWVRFTNAPGHFILEASTNLADTNWVQLSEHKRILDSARRWRTFVYSINELENMEFWRLRDRATP